MAKNHYINNKDFLKEMTAYRTAIRKAKRLGQPKPQIPRYVAECFMKIAENLSHKPNFLSYTFRDEMVADAIEGTTEGQNTPHLNELCIHRFWKRVEVFRCVYVAKMNDGRYAIRFERRQNDTIELYEKCSYDDASIHY